VAWLQLFKCYWRRIRLKFSMFLQMNLKAWRIYTFWFCWNSIFQSNDTSKIQFHLKNNKWFSGPSKTKWIKKLKKAVVFSFSHPPRAMFLVDSAKPNKLKLIILASFVLWKRLDVFLSCCARRHSSVFSVSCSLEAAARRPRISPAKCLIIY
jgi:hypothetical protein